MEWIEAKSLLSAWKKGEAWFGWNYTMNLYRGCCHGCIYCDSRCDCYRIADFDRVRAKKNAIPLLTAELQAKRRKGVIGMGSMSDPYNPLEETLSLTRQALERIARYGFGVGVATKSDRIARDVDCYCEIARRMPVIA
ncbi:MAG TPA: radical SAM protein, partial [Clostridia bacterium]|nr:radical SAM protein [Clostridia bacterium]